MLREAEERAENRMGNIMDGTVAMIREKNTRWLGLLADNCDDKTKSIISSESFQLMSFMIRRKELSASAKIQVRLIYPDFDPEKHFGTITKDEHARIIQFTPAKLEKSLTKDLFFAASVWRTAIRHEEFVQGIIRSLELFADGLWILTGTALIQRLTDYTGKTNYAIDRAMADEIVAELFPEDIAPQNGNNEAAET